MRLRLLDHGRGEVVRVFEKQSVNITIIYNTLPRAPKLTLLEHANYQEDIHSSLYIARISVT